MTQNNIKAAALLINMGGPTNLGEISGFMYRLFNDPHIMKIPGPFRALAARMITLSRTANVKKHYRLIGGGSPLIKWTRRQAEEMRNALRGRLPNIEVKEAYSYSKPSIDEALSLLSAGGYEKIVALPLYPHYSFATLAGIYSELEKGRVRYKLGGRLKIATPFFEHPLYIQASVELLREALNAMNTAEPYRVIFTAHALPQSFIEDGDPYRQQVEKTVSLILKELPTSDWTLSFQSKIGPVKWMKPSTIDAARAAGAEGIMQLLIMPIGFVCDHIETLYELDIELASIAREAGIKKFIRAKVFNDHPLFIKMLSAVIERELD
jgi:ferrochelatase